MASLPDALDALRAALVGVQGDAGALLSSGTVTLLDASSSTVEDVAQATSVQIGNVTYPKTHPTRLARSRNVPALQSGSSSTPESEPESFFTLDAIVFALQMATAQGGLYVVQATSKGLPRFEAVERPEILAYLTGKRPEWEGVLSIQDLQQRVGAADQGRWC